MPPNILERNFLYRCPESKWVTDITEFKLFGEKKLYVSPVLDLYNGEIITYTIGSRPTYSLVSEMLEKALERLPENHPATDAFRSRMALSNETIRPYT